MLRGHFISSSQERCTVATDSPRLVARADVSTDSPRLVARADVSTVPDEGAH